MKEKDAFTADEVQRLMAQLPEDRIGWSIRLLLGTGMRTQEPVRQAAAERFSEIFGAESD